MMFKIREQNLRMKLQEKFGKGWLENICWSRYSTWRHNSGLSVSCWVVISY